MMDKNEEKIVAIIGRPNVGKSTLFNRLVGRRIAIESEVSGTTRDRLFGTVSWAGRQFTLVDVAGLETGSKKEIDQKMQLGVNIAIESADLIIFAVDWHEPENQVDRKVARILRNSSKKVLLAVNKVDNVRRFDDVDVFKRLGFSDPWPVSAISGLGTGDLLDEVIKNLDFQTNDPKYIRADADCDLKLAIIGRPNVGKLK
ncbi:MAG: 50S ribosome-binding GTPase [Candidatus Berkelbacteria bacterium]|nr:50S ribosome-binding GTPase [Candidatus Berkelbacteria bacterium]